MLKDFLKPQTNPIVLNKTSENSINKNNNETASVVGYVRNKMTKDFTQQFVSHNNNKTDHDKSGNTCSECFHQNKIRKMTHDISCQWKPDVRNFAVQSPLVNMRPEVTEAAVQVEPCIFKRNEKETALLQDPVLNSVVADTTTTQHNNLVGNKEEIEISANEKNPSSCVLAGPTNTKEERDLQLPETDPSLGSIALNNEEIDHTNQNEQIIQQQQQQQQQQIIEPDQQSISSTNNEVDLSLLNGVQDKVLTHQDGLVELDYSHIPAEILQQILQQTSTVPTAAISKVTVADNSNVEPLEEGLKPMYFIVDPVKDSYLIPKTTHNVVQSVSLLSFYCSLKLNFL